MPDPEAPRPMRADARRNYERILTAAAGAFARDGAGVSFEEIARQAGVGSATLYRHFPTRADLFDAVYVHEVQTLCDSAGDLAGEKPGPALVAWLRHFVDFITTKRAFAEEMAHDSDVVLTSRARIYATVGPLLARAHEARVVRPDASADDILRLLTGIALMHFPEPGQRERVVQMGLDGIRPQRARAS